MVVVDSKDGYGVEISCYKNHYCAPVVVWSGYGVVLLSITNESYIVITKIYKIVYSVADVLTKPLARVKFEYFRGKLAILHI